jgi:hypothetical protein
MAWSDRCGLKKAKTSALFEMETQTLDSYSKARDAHRIELANGHLVTFAVKSLLSTSTGESSGTSACPGQVTQDYAVAQSGQSALKA